MRLMPRPSHQILSGESVNASPRLERVDLAAWRSAA